jgi:hypothetical protein
VISSFPQAATSVLLAIGLPHSFWMTMKGHGATIEGGVIIVVIESFKMISATTKFK